LSYFDVATFVKLDQKYWFGIGVCQRSCRVTSSGAL